MSLNDDIVDTEKPDGICSFTLVYMIFMDYFYIHHSFLSMIQGLHK